MAPLLSEEELALGDPYEVLGVPVDATEKQIRSAYRSLSLRCHPDRFPDDEKAAKQFFDISLAVNLLTDASKRSFLNGRIEEDQRKKEKTAGMEKKRRTMVEALQAREEEAKRAKLDLARAHADASAEASVQEIGRKMREEAARVAEVARVQAVEDERRRLQELGQTPTSNKNDQARNGEPKVLPENSLELTLMMQFPSSTAESAGPASSPESLRAALSARYGPLENIDLLPQAGPSELKPKKNKKPKGPRYAVEFKRTNSDGCWACWKDHLESGADQARPLVLGTKVKFAGKKDGECPPWVDSLGLKRNHIDPVQATPTPPKVSTTFTSSFPAVPVSSFPSVPSSFPTPESKRKQQEEQRERRAADDFESGILFRMRQQEREKLERQIREQEEAEEARG